MQSGAAAVLESAAEAGAGGAQDVELISENRLLIREDDFAVVGLEVFSGAPLGVVSHQRIPRASVHHVHSLNLAKKVSVKKPYVRGY
jgi:hypothetical protein